MSFWEAPNLDEDAKIDLPDIQTQSNFQDLCDVSGEEARNVVKECRAEWQNIASTLPITPWNNTQTADLSDAVFENKKRTFTAQEEEIIMNFLDSDISGIAKYCPPELQDEVFRRRDKRVSSPTPRRWSGYGTSRENIDRYSQTHGSGNTGISIWKKK